MEKALLNVKQTAEYIGVSVTTFNTTVRFRDDFPKKLTIGKLPKWRKSDIDKWMLAV